jgi:hypothetical protein
MVIPFGILSTSCLKESGLNSLADTIKVAKIYQPDGVIGKDAIIESISPDSCFENSPHLTAFSWTNGGLFNTARTFIEFNLSDMPVKTKVKAAKLSLYWIRYENLTEHTGDNAFSIYRIIQEWDENTITWNNQPLTSTSHVVSVPKSRSTNQSYLDIDVTNLVQDIIDNSTQSHGFMLKLDEEKPFRLVILASSDCSERNKRPKLVVYY